MSPVKKTGKGKGQKKGKELPSKSAKLEEDAALWAGVTHFVRPLTQGKNRVLDHDAENVEQTAITTPRIINKKPAKRQTPFIGPVQGVHQKFKSNELTHGLAAGVDKRTNLRLIRGQLTVEATLDLHGHTRATAHRALDAFMDAAYASGKRCVRVITGKGLRLDSGEIGVLRQSVPDWLNSPRLRPKVLAFSYATAREGGEGALNVLLKRKR